MPVQRIVVIGASAGGIVALKALVSRLRSDFPAPVLMAMHVASDEYRQHLQVELDISSNDSAFDRAIMEYGEPTRYTCPSCSGVLSKIEEGNTHRFRCHTGHGYSLASLLSEHRVHLENRLWQGLMSLQESISLLNDAAERLRASGDEAGAQGFRAKVEEAKAHADTLRGLTLGEAKLARRVG